MIADSPKEQRHRAITQVTVIGAALDAVLTLVKLILGTLAHSPALLADGLHSLSDLLTDMGVICFAKLSRHDPDDDHPYGHARYETLGTALLGGTLIAVAGLIAWDNLTHWLSQQSPPSPSVGLICIVVLSIASKEWIFRYTRAVAKRLDSALLMANAWHARSDALSSIVVLLGLLASWAGWPQVEYWAALIVAALIGKMGVQLTWDALQDLIDRGVSSATHQQLLDFISHCEGVVDVHMLRSRLMADSIYLDVHIQVAPQISVSEGHHIGEWVMQQLKQAYPRVQDITLHIDYDDDTDTADTALAPLRKAIEQQLQQANIPPYQRLQLHYWHHQVIVELYFTDQATPDMAQVHRCMQYWQAQQPWCVAYHLYLEA